MSIIIKKLRSKKGFSLGELLAATLILLLASQVLARGMEFGVRMYEKSMARSHGKQLCSTLTNTIETELRYTTSIGVQASGESGGGAVLSSYFSPNYGKTSSSFSAVDAKDRELESGEAAIKITTKDNQVVWQRLLSSASYSSYGLKAQIEPVIWNDEKKFFHVTLHIKDKNEQLIVTNTFDVIPVNELIITN